ncbi:Ig-like domain-containing protein [Deinococcus maricopensis]|uniref:Peptidase domain protein n=1 Tax=Deinococcus maricopensis (strain DSM 21211 / LMG 22137 / NRRL B-23946 / LB-34) TaxID=709986 RepID=E8U4F4_DEIML|nr:Ig-like domain-containing protein [Deinococcus maricopensis]ADV68819.1 peptidase domain protein [Deinococcus maricopensis DSM 21211]
MHPRKFALLALAIPLVMAACTDTSTPPLPALKVTLQADPATVNLPGATTLTATTSRTMGVQRVEFYEGTTKLGEDSTAPYTFTATYTYANNGAHTYTARAVETNGKTADGTATVTVNIADAFEPNDSAAAAAPLTYGQNVTGSIAGQDRDYDWFKFTAKAGDQVLIRALGKNTNPTSTLDPVLYLYAPDGKTLLERDDDGGTGLDSEIRYNVLTDGTYVIGLTSFTIKDDATAKDNSTTNTYRLELSLR